jgi:hypothetical protein
VVLPNFFLRFTDKSIVEALAILNVAANYIPIAKLFSQANADRVAPFHRS